MKEKESADQRPAGSRDYRILILLIVGVLVGVNAMTAFIGHPKSQTALPVIERSESIPDEMRPFFFLPVRLNYADQTLLESIPGIGPRLAKKIISLRKERNGFSRMDDLLDIEGIGPRKFSVIKQYCSL